MLRSGGAAATTRRSGRRFRCTSKMRRQSLADTFNSPRKFSVRFTDNDGSQGVRSGDNVEDVSQEGALCIAFPACIAHRGSGQGCRESWHIRSQTWSTECTPPEPEPSCMLCRPKRQRAFARKISRRRKTSPEIKPRDLLLTFMTLFAFVGHSERSEESVFLSISWAADPQNVLVLAARHGWCARFLDVSRAVLQSRILLCVLLRHLKSIRIRFLEVSWK